MPKIVKSPKATYLDKLAKLLEQAPEYKYLPYLDELFPE